MSKLTKQQRLAAYNRVLHELQTHSVAQLKEDGEGGIYVCNRLSNWAYYEKEYGINIEDFTEFYAQKPIKLPTKHEHWWKHEDKDSRIKALQRAIKLCEEATE